MSKVQVYEFISGAETATLPTAGTPTDDSDVATKAYVDATASGGIIINDSKNILNLGFTATVASNALTISLKNKDGSTPTALSPVNISFRHSTVTTGQYNLRSVTSALSLVVSSGSTLGHSSSTNEYAYIYAIDNSGTVELAISSKYHGDEGSVITTTAEGGAGGADSKTVIYSTTARNNVPFRIIGRIKSNQTTAGTWASAISELSVVPFKDLYLGQQISSSTGTFSTTSTSLVDVTNATVTITTSGRPVDIRFIPDGTGSDSLVGIADSTVSDTEARFLILRDGSEICRSTMRLNADGTLNMYMPCGFLNYVDTPVAGTYVYKLQTQVIAGTTSSIVQRIKMVAFEL